MPIRILALSFVCLVVCVGGQTAAFGQDRTEASAEKGTLDEIVSSNLKKVFIHSLDFTAYDIIFKELSKNSFLEIVERKDEAGFILGFELRDETTGVSVLGTTASSGRAYGLLLAVRPVGSSDKRQARILWQSTEREVWKSGMKSSRHPAVNAVRAFLDALKGARKDYEKTLSGSGKPQIVVPTTVDLVKADLPQAYGVNLKGFEHLENGMTYAQVVRILGKEGTQTADSNIAGTPRLKMYQWKAKGGLAIIQVMFTNDKLTQKFQVGF